MGQQVGKSVSGRRQQSRESLPELKAQGKGTNRGGSGVQGAIAKNNLVCRGGHGGQSSLLKRRVPSIAGQRVQQHDLVDGIDVRKKALKVIRKLRGKHVAQGAGLPELARQLVRGATKMAEKNLSRLGVRCPARRTDQGVHRGPRRRSKKWKESVKTLQL